MTRIRLAPGPPTGGEDYNDVCEPVSVCELLRIENKGPPTGGEERRWGQPEIAERSVAPMRRLSICSNHTAGRPRGPCGPSGEERRASTDRAAGSRRRTDAIKDRFAVRVGGGEPRTMKDTVTRRAGQQQIRAREALVHALLFGHEKLLTQDALCLSNKHKAIKANELLLGH